MIDIPITIGGSCHEGRSKTTTTADFPEMFLLLDGRLKATLIGQCAEYLARIVPMGAASKLDSLPNPTRLDLLIDVTGGVDVSFQLAEIAFPVDLNAEQRQAAAYAVGVGLHQCAVELARQTLERSSEVVNGD